LMNRGLYVQISLTLIHECQGHVQTSNDKSNLRIQEKHFLDKL